MPYRIIVAEPSVSVQRIVQAAFPEPEFRLYPFEDGPSMLEALENVRPDAVLVSLHLAARDGEEIGRALRSREAFGNLPVIGLRGTFEPVDMDRIRGEDYDAVVRKPFDSDRLVAAVRELIVRKTGPSTLPEEPVWTSEVGAAGPPGEGAGQAAPPDPALREWVRGEIVAMEREIEKRVRVRLLAELEERKSRADRGPDPEE